MCCEGTRMKIGILSHMFPTKRHPHSGIFVKETIDRLVSYVDVDVIATLTEFQMVWRGTFEQRLPGVPCKAAIRAGISPVFLSASIPGEYDGHNCALYR